MISSEEIEYEDGVLDYYEGMCIDDGSGDD